MVNENESLKGLSGITNNIAISQGENSSHQKSKEEKGQSSQKEKEYKSPHREKLIVSDTENDIELGSLIIEKKNLEITLYDKILKKSHNKNDSEINLLKKKILEINKKLSNFDKNQNENNSKEFKIDEIIDNLLKIKKLYEKYSVLVNEEYDLIIKDNLEDLSYIMKKKNKILEQTELLSQSSDISFLSTFEDANEKKIKAISLVSDIKKEMNKIIEKETENSVELQSRKKMLQQEIGKISAKSKVIKGYSNYSKKSYYIDTSK